MKKGFRLSPRAAFLGCLGFVALGIFILNQPGTIDKFIGAITVFVFGAGGCILVWNALRGQGSEKTRNAQIKPARTTYASSIEEISVEKQELNDVEVLEHWARVGDNLSASFQAVSATKTDGDDFAWQVNVWAGEHFRQGEVADQLNDEIYSALSAVAGVRAVGRDDNEHWAVDGDCSGKLLVQAAALANDRVLHRYQEGAFKFSRA